MSELMTTKVDTKNHRRQLLLSVSALALLVHVCGPAAASDDEQDRPTVWVELGGQLEQIQSEQQTYVAPFFDPPASFVTISPKDIQRPPRYSLGGEAAVSFMPQESDWVFSAIVRYGQSNNAKSAHENTNVTKILIPKFNEYVTAKFQEYADAAAKHNESHLILDFQAGKDVGVGMFGRDSTNTFAFGVRFAQFTSQSTASLGELPTRFHYEYIPLLHTSVPLTRAHFFRGQESDVQSFRGVGPSLSWSGSAPVLGDIKSMSLNLDWGANVALLFGRQKAHTHHQTENLVRYNTMGPPTTMYERSPDSVRSRSMLVPNIGGFAGLSFRYANAKISLGYRGDFFFGAMDGGIDTRESENRSFYGPFATVSIGFGG